MTLRKPRVRLHADSMVRIDTALPSIESYKIQQDQQAPTMSFDSAMLKAYPRVLRNRRRVDHLEVKLQVDMLRELDGLSAAQRTPLLKIIDKNAQIRRTAGFDPGVFEVIEDETYDYALKFGPLVSQRPDNLHTQATASHDSDTGLQAQKYGDKRISNGSLMSNSKLKQSEMSLNLGEIREEPAIQSNESDLSQSVCKIVLDDVELEDDLFEVEFPIEEYKLQSEKDQEDEDEITHINRYVRMHTTQKETDFKKMYAQMVTEDPGAKPADQGTTITSSDSGNSGRNDLEHMAMQQMKQVSSGLQKWIVDVLDNSIQLDPKVLEEVNFVPPSDATQAFDADGVPIPNKAPEKELAALERVDISGFDVLLNACKPSILEAKPAVRLNVVHEVNPPDTLVNTLQKNLGMSLEERQREAAMGRQRKVLPAVESSFTYKKKVVRPRPHYGTWYVPPKLWNKVMHDTEMSKKASKNKGQSIGKDTKRTKIGGIVQEKLDQIARKREIEQERFMKELEATQGPGAILAYNTNANGGTMPAAPTSATTDAQKKKTLHAPVSAARPSRSARPS